MVYQLGLQIFITAQYPSTVEKVICQTSFFVIFVFGDSHSLFFIVITNPSFFSIKCCKYVTLRVFLKVERRMDT